MPTQFILNGWKIQMFADEVERPHFHVDDAGEIYRFALSDFSQLATDRKRAPAGMARKIRKWAEFNREALERAYLRLSTNQKPDKSLFR